MIPRPRWRNGHAAPSRFALLGLIATATAVAVGACIGAPGSGMHGRQAPSIASGASLTPPVAPSSAYRAVVTQRVADALHQSLGQIAAQLDEDPSATLMILAKPLGLALDQLSQVLLAALMASGDSRVSAGAWTTQQAALEQQFWAAQPYEDLVAEISRWMR